MSNDDQENLEEAQQARSAAQSRATEAEKELEQTRSDIQTAEALRVSAEAKQIDAERDLNKIQQQEHRAEQACRKAREDADVAKNRQVKHEELANKARGTVKSSREQLGKLVKTIRKQQSAIAYVSALEVDRSVEPCKIRLSDFSGLVYYQLVKTETSCKLVSAWNSLDEYELHKEPFVKRFVPGTTAATFPSGWAGRQFAAILPAIRLRRRLSIFIGRWGTLVVAVLATFAAIIGHFDAILDVGARYFATATINLNSPAATLNVRKGKRFSTQFKVQNISRFGSCYVEIRDARLFDAEKDVEVKGIRLDDFSTSTFPFVKPSQVRSIDVPGHAVKSGTYRIRIDGYSTSVYGGQRKEFHKYRKVEVWDNVKIVIESKPKVQSQKNRCDVHFTVRCGHNFPQGLEFEAQIDRATNIDFEGVSLMGTEESEKKPVEKLKGQEVARLTWKSKHSFEQFTVVPGHIKIKTINGMPLDEKSWREVINKLVIRNT